MLVRTSFIKSCSNIGRVIKMAANKPVLYSDIRSPQVRAVWLLKEALNIDLVEKSIDLFRGEHLSEDYRKVIFDNRSRVISFSRMTRFVQYQTVSHSTIIEERPTIVMNITVDPLAPSTFRAAQIVTPLRTYYLIVFSPFQVDQSIAYSSGIRA